MMTFVLDTNVVSELMNRQGSKQVKDWVAAQPRKNLFTTTITQAEVLYGIAILPEGKRQQALLEAAQLMFQEDFAGQILAFDSQAARLFAQIAAYRKRKGQPISQADAQIAAICLAHNSTIVTRNVDDFINCQISIVNPWDSE